MSTRFVCILVEILAPLAQTHDHRWAPNVLARNELVEASEGVDNLRNRKLRHLRLLLRDNSPLCFELRSASETTAALAGVY